MGFLSALSGAFTKPEGFKSPRQKEMDMADLKPLPFVGEPDLFTMLMKQREAQMVKPPAARPKAVMRTPMAPTGPFAGNDQTSLVPSPGISGFTGRLPGAELPPEQMDSLGEGPDLPQVPQLSGGSQLPSAKSHNLGAMIFNRLRGR